MICLGMATTALDGTFTMDRIAGDGDYKLSVSAFSGAPQPLAWNGEPPALVHVADGDALVTGVHLAVVLPSTTVRGTVLDDAELPVPDAVVRASPSAVEITAGTAWPLTRTNGDGQFAIRIVGDGPFRLEASMGGRPRARVDNVERGATDVVLRLARVGSLEGKLVNLTGGNVTVRALAGASTAFAPAMYFANVDEDTFHLADLTPGDYAISAVSLDGHSAAAVATVQAGLATSVTLSAANTRHLHASVVLFGTGAPVAGVRCVTLAAIGDVLPVRFGFPQAVQAISDASGQLEFETTPAQCCSGSRIQRDGSADGATR